MTGEMVEELILAGADIVKVGIGPGSVCTTRFVLSGDPRLLSYYVHKHRIEIRRDNRLSAAQYGLSKLIYAVLLLNEDSSPAFNATFGFTFSRFLENLYII